MNDSDLYAAHADTDMDRRVDEAYAAIDWREREPVELDAETAALMAEAIAIVRGLS